MQAYPVPQMKDEQVDYLKQRAFVLPSSQQMVPQRNNTSFNPLQNGMSMFSPPEFDDEVDMQQNDRMYPRYGTTGDF
jgi:hypothetical protein